MLAQKKFKICKRLGPGIYDKCQTQKFALAEARKERRVKSGKRPRTLSEFGKGLIEKQRAKFMYGVSERQFRGYVARTLLAGAVNPAERLYAALETRLDNVLYRAGFAPTRRAARQLVSHGHITVNDKNVRVPSLSVRAGDVVSVRAGSRSKGPFSGERALIEKTPAWMLLDLPSLSITVKGVPVPESDPMHTLGQVLEFYSR